jgi:hypothetical protein
MRTGTNCGNIELPGLLRGVFAMKNLDWTFQEADHFKAERREPGGVDGKTSLDKLFAVLEPTGQVSPDDPVDVPSRTEVSSNLPAFTQAPPSTSANGWVEVQMPELLIAVSNLHKAIVEPGISAAKEDRDRAITLRWALREIQNSRLKWLPVNQKDLQILIIMGPVEMQDDAPVLTSAGLSAIV